MEWLLQLSLAVYFFIVPMEFYLNAIVPSGSVVKYLGGFIVVLGIFVMLGKKKITFHKYSLGIIIWCLLEIISLYWASSYANYYMGTYVNVSIFFVTVTAVSFQKKQLTNFIYASLLGSFLAAILLLKFNDVVITGGVRRTITLNGFQLGPNGAAAFFATGIAISLYYLFSSKYKKICLGLILVHLLALLHTGSRGGLLTTVVVFLACFLWYIRTYHQKRGFFIKLLLSLTFLGLIFYIASSQLPNELKERLFHVKSYEGGSNRILLWKALIPQVWDKFLLGHGAGGVLECLNKEGSHNTYLWILTETGVIGLISFMSSVVIIGIKNIKNKNFLAICLLIAGLTPAFFLDALGFRWFWNGILLGALLLNYDKSHVEKEVVNELDIGKNRR